MVNFDNKSMDLVNLLSEKELVSVESDILKELIKFRNKIPKKHKWDGIILYYDITTGGFKTNFLYKTHESYHGASSVYENFLNKKMKQQI